LVMHDADSGRLDGPTRLSFSAIVFDLDGVLVHSSDSVQRSWREWAVRQGLDVETVMAATHGRRSVDTIREVAPQMPAERAAAELEALQALDTYGIRPGIGAAELLRSLLPHEWAIATSGTRALAYARLDAAGLPRPEILVAGDDVAHGKPSPDGFRLAVRLLELLASECIVIEDAPAGVAAARAAGLRVVGITNGDDPGRLGDVDAVTEHCGALRVVRESAANLFLSVSQDAFAAD